jgi:2-polyprenyl-3-methyl-5-hydroxy-6-metoxy-1,4-benzoquinol methylase
MNLSDITPQAMLDRIAEMSAQQPEVETLIYILGRERILEWAHSVGVSTDDKLRDLAPPVPPIELRRIVAAPAESVFLWSGLKDAEMCAVYLDRHIQRPASSPVHVLDFGCGCGRITRFLQAIQRFEISATDVNRSHVAWCQKNLKMVATTDNDVAPPLPFAPAQFDFVYSLSVFTHLPEASMFSWLDELAKVTADNGVVLLTTHGCHAIDILCESEQHQHMFQMSRADAEELRRTFDQRQYIYRQLSSDVVKAADAGDEYGNSFIHETFMRERWARDAFDVVEFVPGGLRGWQDVTVLRRRAR